MHTVTEGRAKDGSQRINEHFLKTVAVYSPETVTIYQTAQGCNTEGHSVLVKSSELNFILMLEDVYCPETSVTSNHSGWCSSKEENVVKWIKVRRISWLSHLERMEVYRIPKKIFTQELEGTRRRGRPKKGWKEELERDLQVVGVRRWRELVADRKKWKDIVRQAKAHSGL